MDQQNGAANTEGKTTIKAKFTGEGGSVGYMNGLVYELLKWEENGMIFISRMNGDGQVAYDSMESVTGNWEMQ